MFTAHEAEVIHTVEAPVVEADQSSCAGEVGGGEATAPQPKRPRVERDIHEGGSCPFLELGIRFFSPREIANLHGFSDRFSFPDSVTDKQARRTLGNSLNVVVVSALLDYLLPGHLTRMGRASAAAP